jgi:hypothetical protein
MFSGFPDMGRFWTHLLTYLLSLSFCLQEDFCHFEIQFEIAHNVIHAMVGSDSKYSMSSLKYTAYDPIFYLHHANVDRLWAVWQNLQVYRGKPYEAICDLNAMRTPLQPFSLGEEVNPYSITELNSLPIDLYNYEDKLNYRYDNLEFNGLSIAQLAKETERRKSYDRQFAGFLLHGIGESCLVEFKICTDTDDCSETRDGFFYVLGDQAEMPWDYHYLYNYEITEQMTARGVQVGDNFYIQYTVTDLSGDDLGTPFGTPTISIQRATGM